jgi:hypothetical protein
LQNSHSGSLASTSSSVLAQSSANRVGFHGLPMFGKTPITRSPMNAAFSSGIQTQQTSSVSALAVRSSNVLLPREIVLAPMKVSVG